VFVLQMASVTTEVSKGSDDSGKIILLVVIAFVLALGIGILIGRYGVPSCDTCSSTAGASTSSESPIQINVGGPLTGSWIADPASASGGIATVSSGTDVSTSTNPVVVTGVTNAAPVAVYQSYRYGKDFTYTVQAVSASGQYTLRLHFAETYFTTAGSRVFSATANGTTVVTDLDLCATNIAAGLAPNTAVVKEVTVTSDSSKNIAVHLVSSVNNAILCGVEILGK